MCKQRELLMPLLSGRGIILHFLLRLGCLCIYFAKRHLFPRVFQTGCWCRCCVWRGAAPLCHGSLFGGLCWCDCWWFGLVRFSVVGYQLALVLWHATVLDTISLSFLEMLICMDLVCILQKFTYRLFLDNFSRHDRERKKQCHFGEMVPLTKCRGSYWCMDFGSRLSLQVLLCMHFGRGMLLHTIFVSVCASCSVAIAVIVMWFLNFMYDSIKRNRIIHLMHARSQSPLSLEAMPLAFEWESFFLHHWQRCVSTIQINYVT